GAASLTMPMPARAGTSRDAGTSQASSAPSASDLATQLADDLFTRYARAYAAAAQGQPVAILNAGSTTARDLGTDEMSADVTVTLSEEDQPVTRAAIAAHPDLSKSTLGDLRNVTLPPRGYDIVQCASLLERIRHAELVLDRLLAATKPGGLLLLRFRD